MCFLSCTILNHHVEQERIDDNYLKSMIYVPIFDYHSDLWYSDIHTWVDVVVVLSD